VGVALRARDWAVTPLGAPDAWPQPLRTALRLLLAADQPTQLWWGPQRLSFHNEAYRLSIETAGDGGSLGRPGREARKVWKCAGPQVEQVMASGEAVSRDNALVPILRDGRREDAYWTHSFAPIDDPTAPNGVGGVLAAWFETTSTVIRQSQRIAHRRSQRRLLEHAPGFITFLGGPDHVYEFINDAHHRLFGSETWLGKPVREAFPDLAGQGFIELLDQVRRTGEPVVLQGAPIHYHRGAGMDEDERFLDLIYAPVTDTDGAVTGIFCQGFDVTDTFVAQKKLRESEAQLQSILDSVPDSVIVLDEHAVIQSFSAAATALLGWTAAEAVGRNVRMLMSVPDREAHDAYLEEFERTGVRRAFPNPRIITAQRKDGSEFPAQLFVGEARTASQRLFTCFVRDLTEQRSAEARLQELQADLLHASRVSAMGELASGLAHELNQPISAVANYLRGARRIVERGDLDRQYLAMALDKAAEQALRAGEVIRGMRDFMDRGDADMRAETLSTLVEEASALAMIGAKLRSVRLTTRLDPAADRILANRVQVQQVLLNLMRNALEAMAETERRELTISSAPVDDNFVAVRVSDSGPGLSEETRKSLFQPFMSTKATGGMGVGLSICRTIVTAHGGSIGVEANPGGGATFVFTLLRDAAPAAGAP
jgi:two-component system sensor kinase FixL